MADGAAPPHLIIAHSGVRLGRKVYLVVMNRDDNRAAMVAVSNTVSSIVIADRCHLRPAPA